MGLLANPYFELVSGTMYTCVHWNGTDYKLAMN